MKLVRKLRPLTQEELGLADRTPGKDNGWSRSVPLPLAPRHPAQGAMDFLSQVRYTESLRGWKHARQMLITKYNDLFGNYPPAGLPLAVVRARITYRMQAEGHRILEVPMAASFAQNMRAVLKFDDEKPYDGCTKYVKQLGTYLAQSEGGVTMEAVKKVVRVVKAQAKIASKETPKATTVKVVPAPAANAKSDGKRPKVYGKYTAKTAVIFLRDTAKADRQKCLAVMKRLVPAVSPITVNATFYNAKAEKVEIEAEDQKRLKALVG